MRYLECWSQIKFFTFWSKINPKPFLSPQRRENFECWTLLSCYFLLLCKLYIMPQKGANKGEWLAMACYDWFTFSWFLFEICRHDAFADINNLDHCIKYLNQSLFTFGFPSALDLYSSEPVRRGLIGQFSSDPCKQMYFSWKFLILWGTMFPE